MIAEIMPSSVTTRILDAAAEPSRPMEENEPGCCPRYLNAFGWIEGERHSLGSTAARDDVRSQKGLDAKIGEDSDRKKTECTPPGDRLMVEPLLLAEANNKRHEIESRNRLVNKERYEKEADNGGPAQRPGGMPSPAAGPE